MLHVGKKIKELREKENLPAETIGKKIGVSKQSILDMERKEDINTARLRQLSSVFNVPLTFFVEDDDSDFRQPSYNELLNICKDLLKNSQQRDCLMIKLKEMFNK